MTLHIAGYKIVMAPGGMVVLGVLLAIAILGAVLLIRALRSRGRP